MTLTKEKGAAATAPSAEISKPAPQLYVNFEGILKMWLGKASLDGNDRKFHTLLCLRTREALRAKMKEDRDLATARFQALFLMAKVLYEGANATRIMGLIQWTWTLIKGQCPRLGRIDPGYATETNVRLAREFWRKRSKQVRIEKMSRELGVVA